MVVTLYRHREHFALTEEELKGEFYPEFPEFYITTGNNLPIRTKPYRYGPQQTKFIQDNREIGKMWISFKGGKFQHFLFLPGHSKRRDGG